MLNETFIVQGISWWDFLFYSLVFIFTAVLLLEPTNKFKLLKIPSVVWWGLLLLLALVYKSLEMKIFISLLAASIFILAFRQFNRRGKS